MPCPCTNGAEIKTGLLNCLAPLCPDFLHGTPPHTDAPAPAHMLCLYFKLTVIITLTDVTSSNGSACVSRMQPGTTGSLPKQVIFSPVRPSENTFGHLLSGCIIPAMLPNPFLHFPTSHQLLVYISEDHLEQTLTVREVRLSVVLPVSWAISPFLSPLVFWCLQASPSLPSKPASRKDSLVTYSLV